MKKITLALVLVCAALLVAACSGPTDDYGEKASVTISIPGAQAVRWAGPSAIPADIRHTLFIWTDFPGTLDYGSPDKIILLEDNITNHASKVFSGDVASGTTITKQVPIGRVHFAVIARTNTNDFFAYAYKAQDIGAGSNEVKLEMQQMEYCLAAAVSSMTIPSVPAGYGSPYPSVNFTITNYGTGYTGNLSVTSVSNPAFTVDITPSLPLSLAPGASATVEVIADPGLTAGTHTDTITISAANGPSVDLNVSFKVNIDSASASAIDAFEAWLNALPTGTTSSYSLNVSDLGGDSYSGGSVGYILRAHNTKLVDLNLSGISAIPDFAFWTCTNLAGITIPNSVQSIGNSAFMNCKGLTGIIIPDSVESIGNNAFFGCDILSSVTLPTNSNFTSIEIDAFTRCIGLTGITIPSNVTSIGQTAFESSGLTSIVIPDTVTTIGLGAFASCTGLISVEFVGATITGLDSYAFGIPGLPNYIGDLYTRYTNSNPAIGGAGTYTRSSGSLSWSK
jgi:hypothetical protein